MVSPTLNLDDFSAESPYAAQLRRGFGTLRFNPELEAEFGRYQLGMALLRIRAWQVITLILGVATIWFRAVADGSFLAPDVLVRVGILTPCSLLLVWACWSPRYSYWYPRALSWISPVLYGVAMVLAAGVFAAGRPMALTFPIISLLAVGLLIGATFYRVLFLSGLIVVSYLGGALHFGATTVTFHYQMALMVVVALVSSILAYSVEKSGRTAFLQNGLLGEMVSQDGLTGVSNRRAFDERMVSAWQQALRDRRSLGVLMIDVDHFKAYNDRYGHQAGDATLRRVAQTVKESSRRPLDMAARYGGEEFALVLYDLADSAVETIAEHIRRSIQQLHIEHADSPLGVVTVSIGIALVRPTLERSPAGVVQLADEALYAAKNDGRNQVRVLVHDQAHLITGQFRKPAKRVTA